MWELRPEHLSEGAAPSGGSNARGARNPQIMHLICVHVGQRGWHRACWVTGKPACTSSLPLHARPQPAALHLQPSAQQHGLVPEAHAPGSRATSRWQGGHSPFEETWSQQERRTAHSHPCSSQRRCSGSAWFQDGFEIRGREMHTVYVVSVLGVPGPRRADCCRLEALDRMHGCIYVITRCIKVLLPSMFFKGPCNSITSEPRLPALPRPAILSPVAAADPALSTPNLPWVG